MVFPKWANQATLAALIGAPLAIVGVITAFALFISPYNTQVGYAPAQPIPYSHKLHAGDLGIDCRYCHNLVEESPHANVPATGTCMNCHVAIRPDRPAIVQLKESWLTGEAMEWIRIHRLPDYVYFDHAIHVNSGVGCESCHGRIDQMEVVQQTKPLSMGWCLDCHRRPEQYLRPQDAITTMGWKPDDQTAVGAAVKEALALQPTTDCSGCHR